ncbi:MAG: hypothetical protein DRJ42_27570 [Deltaproteobacteria bacterium]|nr:MAG: hypothetical protein DRJ42_27570 [Deltaproteobacteria bacterium]
MRVRALLGSSLFLLLLIACGDSAAPPTDSAIPVDGGDAGDGAVLDGAMPDGSVPDGAAPDATVDSGVPPDDFHLPAGHFHPAVMAPALVYPRPDTETNDYARHRWAHAAVEYRIPGAVIQGGAWPFFYEIIEGPPGATIGAQLVIRGEVQVAPDDYGVIRWTPRTEDEGMTFDFHVRVTDQEDTTVDARWAVTVDSSRFVFVSETGGDDGNGGTIDEPLASTAGWFLGDAADTTFAGKLVYYRAGNYQPIGAAANNENLRIEAGKKPMSFMAFPGESVVLDATRGQWTFWAGCDDVFFSGLHFDGSKIVQPDGTLIRNSRNISFYGPANQERITFFENQVSNIQPGNPADDRFGNDNPAFVWRPSTGTRRGRNWAFVGNLFEDAGPRRSNGPSAASLSCVSYAVFEGNTVRRWNGTGTFFDKSNGDHVTQRNNDLWLATEGGDVLNHGLGAGMGDSYDATHDPGYFETCWNRIRVDPGLAAQFGLSSSPGDGPAALYRNSLYGRVWFNRIDNYSESAEGNVIQGELMQDAAAVVAAGDNYHTENLTESVFDAEGALTGAARTSYLGTHGAEVQ